MGRPKKVKTPVTNQEVEELKTIIARKDLEISSLEYKNTLLAQEIVELKRKNRRDRKHMNEAGI